MYRSSLPIHPPLPFAEEGFVWATAPLKNASNARWWTYSTKCSIMRAEALPGGRARETFIKATEFHSNLSSGLLVPSPHVYKLKVVPKGSYLQTSTSAPSCSWFLKGENGTHLYLIIIWLVYKNRQTTTNKIYCMHLLWHFVHL